MPPDSLIDRKQLDMFEVKKASSEEGVPQRRSSPKAADKSKVHGNDFVDDSSYGAGCTSCTTPNGYNVSSSSSPSSLTGTSVMGRSPDSPSKLPRKRRPGSGAGVPGSFPFSSLKQIDRKAFILIFFGVILLILFLAQVVTGYGFMYSRQSVVDVHNILPADVVDKEVGTETSVLADTSGPPDTDESGHTFTLGITKLHQCIFDLSEVSHERGLPIGSTLVNENNYYSHHISVNHHHYIYGQICVESHSHEHIIELYLSSADHAGVDNSHHYDCDLYISANNRLPTDTDWDFRSVNVGSDHIKLPLYLDEFKDSRGSVVIGIKGRGETAPELNQCTLTMKINTVENEELLHKFNLRHGQVLLPRDIKGVK